MKNKLIEKKLYEKICNSIPIVCIDIILQIKNKYLLVKRNNPPLKNYWWVPGGRVKIGENLKDAASRNLKDETGLKIKKFQFFGILDLKFKENTFGKGLYHTVSIVFKKKIKNISKLKLDSQSSKWKLASELPKKITHNIKKNV